MPKYFNFFIKQNEKKNYFSFLNKKIVKNEIQDVYFQMKLIRTFEKKLLDLFKKNLISGTTHTYIGQESNSSAIFNHLNLKEDIIWSNHRCHGHFISYSAKIVELMAEILGKINGICNGRGGSQHLHYKNFYSNGLLGGSLPLAVGSAYASKRKNKCISVVFIGDGTLGSGYLYESMNLSSLWNCPLLIICENNFIAQTTPFKMSVSGEVELRAKSFGLKTFKCHDYDYFKINEIAKKAINYVRSKKKPAFIEIYSTRLGPHSKSDDTRNEKDLKKLKQNDPLIKIQKKTLNSNIIDNECDKIIEKCFAISSKFENAK